MAKYQFLAAVDYDGNDRHYEDGEVDALKDWRKADVKAAVKAGLIEHVKPRATITVSPGNGTVILDTATDLHSLQVDSGTESLDAITELDSDIELLKIGTERSEGDE